MLFPPTRSSTEHITTNYPAPTLSLIHLTAITLTYIGLGKLELNLIAFPSFYFFS